MACGSGKILTTLWIKEKLLSKKYSAIASFFKFIKANS